MDRFSLSGILHASHLSIHKRALSFSLSLSLLRFDVFPTLEFAAATAIHAFSQQMKVHSDYLQWDRRRLHACKRLAWQVADWRRAG